MKDKLYDFINKYYMLFCCTLLFSSYSGIVVIKSRPLTGKILLLLGFSVMCALAFYVIVTANRSYDKELQLFLKQRDSTSPRWDGILRFPQDIEPRLRLLQARIVQDQQEVLELSRLIAESDQTADH